MEKIISLLLVLTMLSSLFVMNVSAEITWSLPESASASHSIRFGLLVDSHITSSGNGSDALNTATASFSNLDIDAMVFSGDIVMHSATELTEDSMTSAYGHLKTVLTNNGISTVANTTEVESGKTPLIYATGNHEFPMGSTNETACAAALTTFKNQMACEQNTHNVVNGYHFITSGGYNTNSFMTTDNMNYIIDEIAVAETADATKPIFLVLHHPIYETVAGSDYATCGEDRYRNSNKSGKSFKEYLNEHPRVIVLSGHTHERIQNPQSVWQDGFTAVGSGYVGGGSSGNFSQGYFVEAEGTIVKFYKMNYLTGEYMGEPWTIDVSSKDEFDFTAAKKAQAKAPVFASNAAVDVSDITSSTATVKWSTATIEPTKPFEDNYIKAYRVVVKDYQNKVISETTYDTKYYLEGSVPTTTHRIKDLAGSTTYQVNVYAVSPLDIESAALTTSFTTAEVVAEPEREFYEKFECEENDVAFYYLGENIAASKIISSSNASGGAFIRTQLAPITWNFTPTKTGYYTFDLVTGGDAACNNGDSTFTIGGATTYTGVIETNSSQSANDIGKAKTTRVATDKALTAGNTYVLSWASKPSSTVCPDYINVYYRALDYEIVECETNVSINGSLVATDSAAIKSDATNASGGKYMQSSGIFSWTYTPEKYGYYTFAIATGGSASAMDGDSTFTVNGKTVYTGVIETTKGWNVINAPETKLFRMYMAKGTTYTLSWASYPVATTVCPDYFKVWYEKPEFTVLECEENGVMINGSAVAEGSSAIISSIDASGGKHVRSNGVFSWKYTPEQNGYYTFEIGTGGDSTSSSGDSTFTVNGTTVYTGVIATTNGWGVKNAPETKLFTMHMEAGTTYTLSWATRPGPSTISPDYFKVWYEEGDSFVFNAETDFDSWAGHGVGWYDTTDTADKGKNGYDDQWMPENEYLVDTYVNHNTTNNIYLSCLGHGVVNMVNREWFRYTLDVEQNGFYRIELAVKKASNTENTADGQKAYFAITTNDDETTKNTVGVFRDTSYNWVAPEYYDFGLYWLYEGENTIKVLFDNGKGSGLVDALRVTRPRMRLCDGESGVEIRVEDGVKLGTYKAKADLTGWLTGDVVPVLYTAIYDENDMLVDAKLTSTVADNVMTTDSITVAEGQYAKLFMWNNGDMKPLMGSLIYEQ